ncbi:MAG: YtxH domain-containing protein [Flavobacterium sp.]
MKADKVVLGILGGVAVGALLGVLFAPEKGSKTRKKIADKSADYAEELKSQIDALIGTIQKKYDAATEDGKDLVVEATAELNKVAKKL